VVSHIRWAEKVHAPVIEQGSADYLIGFEWLEGLRRLSYVHPKGTVLINDCRLDPISVSSGQSEYPDQKAILSQMERSAKKVVVIAGLKTALELGNARILNLVLMGALSKLLAAEKEVWEETLRSRVPPKFLTLNLEAFERGRGLVKG
jgi:indolepyruvate ferredoxin oxidoreductase, beta subunit